ncbi:MAG: acyl carrier protein [Ardenticatenaceae bacterium]|nr:acyl carrier protein [Anaerolineales bacterium]MCB9007033.1 acyl carrier protein [Ardenticatenaceae bacterium]
MEAEIKQQIRTFLAKHFKDYNLKDDEDIFSLGFVNSLFAMQIVLFVEQQMAITIANEDLELDNFRTINAMTNLILSKREPAA